MKESGASEAVDQPSHVRDIQRVRTQLVESMRRVNRLVAALYQARHLSDQERQRIKSQPTMFDRASELLDVLSKKPMEAYQCFLDALMSTNQSHLVGLITNTGDLRNCACCKFMHSAVSLNCALTILRWPSNLPMMH